MVVVEFSEWEHTYALRPSQKMSLTRSIQIVGRTPRCNWGEFSTAGFPYYCHPSAQKVQVCSLVKVWARRPDSLLSSCGLGKADQLNMAADYPIFGQSLVAPHYAQLPDDHPGRVRRSRID